MAWLYALCVPKGAIAYSSGEASESCGCHSGGKSPTVLITPDLTTINPGQLVTLTVSVSATNGEAAGFFLEANSGKLSVVESGTKILGNGVTHSSTRRNASAGSPIVFKVGWTAPAIPGGVDFNAWGNSVNGDGTPRGDEANSAFFSSAFGCTGEKFYHDYDGDGVGDAATGYTVACIAPPHYAAEDGDCNENDQNVHPGAPEVCDGKDNNCDGQTDEGLAVTTYCADADGDGHGVLGKATVQGCRASKGFGLCDGDCNDNDPTVFPGAPELCNDKDDNCDGENDEGARLTCGVGWCARSSSSCTSPCTPGSPRAEQCNDFDDDCDGVNDNGTDLELCGSTALVCRAGYCVPSGSSGSAGSGLSITSGSGGDDAPGAASGGSAALVREARGTSCAFGPAIEPTSGDGAFLLLALSALYRSRRLAMRARERCPQRT